MSVGEFPDPPGLRRAAALAVPVPGVRRALARVIESAAVEHKNAALTAVQWRFEERWLTASAGDGYRLARARCAVPAGDTGPVGRDLLVPARAAGEVHRLLASLGDDEGFLIAPRHAAGEEGYDGEAAAGEDGAKARAADWWRGCWFVGGAVSVYTSFLDGAFPDVGRLIPAEGAAPNSLTVDTAALRQVLSQAGLFNPRGEDARSVLFDVAPGLLTVFAGDEQRGDGLSEIAVEVAGAGARLVFNPGYVNAIIDPASRPPARLNIAWQGPLTAIIVRDADRQAGAETADDAWVLMPQNNPEVIARYEQVRREAAATQLSFAA